MTMTLYGIPNCDTVKKARTWLGAAGVPFVFHNYKIDGINAERLSRWADVVGWDMLLNRAGTTFRKLDPADRADLDRDSAIALMVAHPSLIKRPVIEHDGSVLVGFKPEVYAATFG